MDCFITASVLVNHAIKLPCSLHTELYLFHKHYEVRN